MKFETRLVLFASHAEKMGKATKKQTGTKVLESYDIRDIAGQFLVSLQEENEMGSVVSALKDGSPDGTSVAACIGACKVLANAPLEDLAEFSAEQLQKLADALMELMRNENPTIKSISENAILNMFGPGGLKMLIVDGDYPELRQGDEPELRQGE